MNTEGTDDEIVVCANGVYNSQCTPASNSVEFTDTGVGAAIVFTNYDIADQTDTVQDGSITYDGYEIEAYGNLGIVLYSFFWEMNLYYTDQATGGRAKQSIFACNSNMSSNLAETTCLAHTDQQASVQFMKFKGIMGYNESTKEYHTLYGSGDEPITPGLVKMTYSVAIPVALENDLYLTFNATYQLPGDDSTYELFSIENVFPSTKQCIPMCTDGKQCFNYTCKCNSHVKSCPSGQTCDTFECYCGNSLGCPAGFTCTDNVCMCGSKTECSGGGSCENNLCVCGKTRDCENGETCVNGACTRPKGFSYKNNELMCGTETECQKGETCINDACVCGSTGVACAGGESCNNGVCGCNSESCTETGAFCMDGKCSVVSMHCSNGTTSGWCTPNTSVEFNDLGVGAAIYFTSYELATDTAPSPDGNYTNPGYLITAYGNLGKPCMSFTWEMNLYLTDANDNPEKQSIFTCNSNLVVNSLCQSITYQQAMIPYMKFLGLTGHTEAGGFVHIDSPIRSGPDFIIPGAVSMSYGIAVNFSSQNLYMTLTANDQDNYVLFSISNLFLAKNQCTDLCTDGKQCFDRACKCNSKQTNCPSGQTCRAETAKCYCGDLVGCPTGFTCKSEVCKCGTKTACNIGETCVNNACVCGNSSYACYDGETCTKGVCGCIGNVCLGSTAVCENGVCVTSTTCGIASGNVITNMWGSDMFDCMTTNTWMLLVGVLEVQYSTYYWYTGQYYKAVGRSGNQNAGVFDFSLLATQPSASQDNSYSIQNTVLTITDLDTLDSNGYYPAKWSGVIYKNGKKNHTAVDEYIGIPPEFKPGSHSNNNCPKLTSKITLTSNSAPAYTMNLYNESPYLLYLARMDK